MSKITLSTILTLVRIILSFGEKVVRLIYSIVDICDDGIINGSVDKPAWYDQLIRIINNIEMSFRELGEVSDEISTESRS